MAWTRHLRIWCGNEPGTAASTVTFHSSTPRLLLRSITSSRSNTMVRRSLRTLLWLVLPTITTKGPTWAASIQRPAREFGSLIHVGIVGTGIFAGSARFSSVEHLLDARPLLCWV